MSATAKYFLGRLGLFLAVGAILLPTGLNTLIIAMIALVASFLLSFVVLKKWRLQMMQDVDQSMDRRRQRKDQLRRELSGEDEE